MVAGSMIGMGYYGSHHTAGHPAATCWKTPAWYTAYTPYQPEISQGRLEAHAELPDHGGGPYGHGDSPTPRLLDESSAAAEAMTVSPRKVGKS